MPRYEIATDETKFDVTTRPGIPGVGARVTGVRGMFDATFDEDGKVDLTHPVTGEYTMSVGDLGTGNQLLTAAVRRWLGDAEQTAVQGRIGDVRARADGRLDFSMHIDMKGRHVPLVGTGRIHMRPNGQVEATGGTLCDPRAFGLPLPPLLNLVIHVRWRLLLAPLDPAGDDIAAAGGDAS